MNTPKLWKVCGMREAGNIVEVANCVPNFMGFIFYELSPRYVGADFKIPENMFNVERTGVFVNSPINAISEMALRHELSFAQLHGDESPEFCKEVKSKGIDVIKVFSIDSEFDFSKTLDFDGVADLFLFDTKGRQRGGNGFAFDWKKVYEYKGTTKFLLSGGLSVANLTEALSIDHDQLIGFDFNSGIESSPGVKDIQAVKKIASILTNHGKAL